MPDSEAAVALRDRFRESPLAKSDDASIDPPRYWKQFVSKVVGNQKVGVELFTSIGRITVFTRASCGIRSRSSRTRAAASR